MPRNPITRREFADQITAALRAESAEGEFSYDEIENALTQDGRPPFPLEEHFLEAQGQAPHLLEQLVRAYAYLHLHPPEQPATWAEARDLVFPYVRPMAFHAHRGFRALQGERLDLVPYGAITEHVTVCVGTPRKWKTLTATVADLERWGVTFDQALAAARENVRKRPTREWQRSNQHPGVFRSPWNDEYGIARLLFQGAFSGLPLHGDPVVIAPTWQGVLVAGSDDEEGLVHLGAIGRQLLEREDFLIYRPMRVRGEAIEHWLPPRRHRAHLPLKFLHLANERGDYAEQARVGRRHFERQERPSNIPIPQVCSFQGGADFGTIATWREGPPCALPKVDYVVLKRKTEDLGIAKWADVQRVLGAELEALNTYPPRWLATSFPADWQLTNLNLVPWGPGQSSF